MQVKWVISGSAGTKLQMVVRARTKGSIACLYKRWSELGQRGLLPVFTNGGQSSDKGVYCLSLQTVVRARTKGSIACLYKWWLELGHGGLLSCLYKWWSELGHGGLLSCLWKRWAEPVHGGLLPVFTNGGQSSDKGVYCLSLQMVVRARTWGSIVLSLQMVVRARTWGSIVLSLQTVGRARTRGSIACLCKRWSEPGHGGVLPQVI